MDVPDPYSMVETTQDGSGWVWIIKHTRFVDGVFYDLRSYGRGRMRQIAADRGGGFGTYGDRDWVVSVNCYMLDQGIREFSRAIRLSTAPQATASKLCDFFS
jgi:hypothetical protein